MNGRQQPKALGRETPTARFTIRAPFCLKKKRMGAMQPGGSTWRKCSLPIAPPLFWQETGPLAPTYPQATQIAASPQEWGDVILARKDCPTSYHLSVVLDDAAQGITHVVRGQDLYVATSLHRLLQSLLDLPAPRYHHHRLLTDIEGQKLSKSRQSLSLRALRKDGVTPSQIKKLIRWSDADLEAFTAV